MIKLQFKWGGGLCPNLVSNVLSKINLSLDHVTPRARDLAELTSSLADPTGRPDGSDVTVLPLPCGTDRSSHHH